MTDDFIQMKKKKGLLAKAGTFLARKTKEAAKGVAESARRERELQRHIKEVERKAYEKELRTGAVKRARRKGRKRAKEKLDQKDKGFLHGVIKNISEDSEGLSPFPSGNKPRIVRR